MSSIDFGQKKKNRSPKLIDAAPSNGSRFSQTMHQSREFIDPWYGTQWNILQKKKVKGTQLSAKGHLNQTFFFLATQFFNSAEED